MFECGGEEVPVKKLQKLQQYLTSNREGLRPYAFFSFSRI